MQIIPNHKWVITATWFNCGVTGKSYLYFSSDVYVHLFNDTIQIRDQTTPELCA